jgi:ferredoxin
MEKYSVAVNQETCIGCITCTQICSNFELEQKPSGLFKSKPIVNVVTDDITAHKAAEAECPVNCISVKKIS